MTDTFFTITPVPVVCHMAIPEYPQDNGRVRMAAESYQKVV